MSDRMPKVDELIKRELGQIIAKEIEFPLNTLATITRVETLPDLKQAKVFISVFPVSEQQRVIRILSGKANELVRLLNKKVILRIIPKLNFLIDDLEEKAAEIDRLLDNLK
ncbi:MAG: 30S ribosome-binding factor RbfA [Patescibacteria group bacterium]